MNYPVCVGSFDYDRWKCREFVHRALQRISEDQLPLFWYYLAFDRDDALGLLVDVSEDVQALRTEWTQMQPLERENILRHFVLIMEHVARDVAAQAATSEPHQLPLPRKVPEDDDPE